MKGRRAVGILAIAVLGVGTLVSVAMATRPCGAKVCSDEVAAACGSETGSAFRTCKRLVLRNCRTTSCTCDGSGTPCEATATTTTTTSCPPATAAYCGGTGCGPGGTVSCQLGLALCPQGMTCTLMGMGCACTGDTIPCGDPRLSGLTCNFCKWGTCPAGMTCGGVPKTSGCGFDCACQ
jgi:hypothetical protein